MKKGIKYKGGFESSPSLRTAYRHFPLDVFNGYLPKNLPPPRMPSPSALWGHTQQQHHQEHCNRLEQQDPATLLSFSESHSILTRCKKISFVV
jgi:hypothetical protein